MNLEPTRMTSIAALRPTTVLTAGAFALALVSAPQVATAACHPPPGESAEPGTPAARALEDCRWEHRNGLELTARLGLSMGLDPANPVVVPNGASATNGQRLGPGFGIDMALGWRIRPSFSLGGHLFYGYSPAAGLSTDVVDLGARGMYMPTGGHTDMVAAGMYGRFYIGSAVGLRRIEPWVGIGFDFPSPVWVSTQVHASRQVTSATGTSTQSGDGSLIATLVSFGVPVSAGIDYNVTPEFSLGISAHVSLLFPYGRCVNTSIFTGDPDATATCAWQSYDVTPMLFVAGGGRFLAPW